MSRYDQMRIYVAPESAGASFALSKQYLVAEVPYDNKQFNLGSLNLSPDENYYIRSVPVNARGTKGQPTAGVLYEKPTASLNSRPVGHIGCTNQVITTSIANIQDGSVISDPYAMFDTTNHYFVAPIDGLYRLSYTITVVITTPGASTNDIVITDGTDFISAQTVQINDLQVLLSGYFFKRVDLGDQIRLAIEKTINTGVIEVKSESVFSLEYISN